MRLLVVETATDREGFARIEISPHGRRRGGCKDFFSPRGERSYWCLTERFASIRGIRDWVFRLRPEGARIRCAGPVDMSLHPNKFKGLWVLALSRHPEQRPANCAPALMGSLDGSEGQRTNAVGRFRSRHSVSTLPKSNAGQSNARCFWKTGAPWVPVRAAVANAPGGGGWIPVPTRGGRSTRVFAGGGWEGLGVGARVFGV
jgi:hypothetical protein